jgi:hypothetical protein
MSPVLTPGAVASGPAKNATWFQVITLMALKELADAKSVVHMALVSDTQFFDKD